MTPDGSRTRFRRCHAAALGFLLASAVSPVGAAEIGVAIAAIRIVPPHPDRPFRPVFTEQQIRSYVKETPGHRCDVAAIVEALSHRYRFLGYVPTIQAACEEDGLHLTIRESSHRIDLITFDPAEISRIGVTQDSEFEEKARLYPVPAGGPRALLRALLETREGDLYNFQRYRDDRLALARLGYRIAFIGGAARDAEDYPPGAYLVQSLAPPPADRSSRRETNYLGATGGYAPNAGGSVGLLYQKDALFGRYDQLTITPTYDSQIGGAITYRSPLLAHREDPRRLYDFEIDLFSNFQHNRDLLGVETDQRRSGIGGSIGIRPLGIRAPNNLRLQIGFRHERLDLSRPPPGEEEENLTLLQLGATQEWHHTYRRPSLTLRLAPNFDFALNRGGGARSFVRPSLDATLHSRVPSGLEFDFHFLAGTVDRAVPAVEQWTLGGPTTVRGFREDAVLGRDLTALQSEIWIPFVRSAAARLPPAADEEDPVLPRFEPRAARFIRMALFVDGGTMARSAAAGSTALYGAGVGLRFVVPHQPLIVRIDYGWGLGVHGGDSFPYLSLAYRF